MTALSGRRLRTFSQLADVLIPGDSAMPAASDAGVVTYLARVLEVAPSLAAPLVEVLDAAAVVEPEKYVRALYSEASGEFDVLSACVIGTYFLDDRVRASLGYPGQVRTEFSEHDMIGLVEEGLLDPVVASGITCRPA